MWDKLNGKKTVIGGVLLWLAWALGGVPDELHAAWIDTAINLLDWIGGILLPGGLIHKGVKAANSASDK